MIKIIFCLCVWCFLSSVASAETASISNLHVSVTTEGTTVSINAPVDFSYSEFPDDGRIEILFNDCLLDVRDGDLARIPSFSPLFRTIEIRNIREENACVLVINLVDKTVRPAISVKPSESKISFKFIPKPVGDLTDLLPIREIDPVIEVAKSHTTIAGSEEPGTGNDSESQTGDSDNRTSRIPVPTQPEILQVTEIHEPEFNISEQRDEVVQIPKVTSIEGATPPEEIEEIEEIDQIQDVEEIEESTINIAEIKEEESVEVEEDFEQPVPNLSVEEIEPLNEIEELETPEPAIEIPLLPQKQTLTDQFPQATLDAIHYTQGQSNRDIITLEFTGNSPEFNYDFDESGNLVISLHNLVTPESLLSGDFIRREVQGSTIKFISLTRFTEMDMPSLQIGLIGTSPLEFELEDFDGILDIMLWISED